MNLAGHARAHGLLPYRGAARALRSKRSRSAALTGRGGAGCPASRRAMTAVAEPAQAGGCGRQRRRRRACQPEGRAPARALSPHLVLDGLQLAAEAVGARRAYLYAHDDDRPWLSAAGAPRLAERSAVCCDRIAVELVAAPPRSLGLEARSPHWPAGSAAGSARPAFKHTRGSSRARRRRRAHAGAERRDARPRGAHRPVRRGLVPRGRNRRGTGKHAWSPSIVPTAPCSSARCRSARRWHCRASPGPGARPGRPGRRLPRTWIPVAQAARLPLAQRRAASGGRQPGQPAGARRAPGRPARPGATARVPQLPGRRVGSASAGRCPPDGSVPHRAWRVHSAVRAAARSPLPRRIWNGGPGW